ncbi:biotin--[acetyl-CoA-carboxylase] ligase [Olsenella sp. An285]|uniref:biotin--[acetyl-CoA-carboxylase] ligase n=1 Tax=Olsenella sp. An285 TaxID=1965621 RepID=UPI001F1572A2|nr:biotin--[acetyl-CoA-carboxylase] ligase [Olsenella sp. An285]
MLPPLQTLEEVGSTNDEARALGRSGAPSGAAVAARRQTAGRGRRGHTWASPEGNLYLSVLLRPAVPPSKLPGLAAACGLGMLDALDGFGLSNVPQLKWPNDVLARERKLAGILVEAGRDEAGETFAVCGVGVNIERAPANLGAICLADLGAAPSFSALAEALRDGIVARTDAWAAAGGIEPLAGIRDDYLARLTWLGQQVVALSPEGYVLCRGNLLAVDLWGRAVVEAPDGPRSFSTEQVSLRSACPPTGAAPTRVPAGEL